MVDNIALFGILPGAGDFLPPFRVTELSRGLLKRNPAIAKGPERSKSEVAAKSDAVGIRNGISDNFLPSSFSLPKTSLFFTRTLNQTQLFNFDLQLA